MLEKIIKATANFLVIIIISLAIFLPVRFLVARPFYVKGASMEPSLFDHEYLIVDEISYRFNGPRRGDIVVFRYPLNQREHFIKRIIGLPGEKIQIKDTKITIFNKTNPGGFIIKEPYLDPEVKTYSYTERPITLDENEYFILGDNRAYSQDSRAFGPIHRDHIVGRVFLRGWPLTRVTVFENPLAG